MPSGKEPPYIRKKEEAEQKRQERQQHEDHIQVVLSLNRITDEQQTSRDQAERHEEKKSLRDKLTIAALFFAAVAAIIAVIVSHRDTMHALKDARFATSQQFAASTAQLREMAAQVGVMRDQLAEAKSERAITIAQTRANILRTDISVTPINDKGTFDGDNIVKWAISPVYVNTGPTDAEDYRSWFDIKTFTLTGPHTVTAAECPRMVPSSSLKGGSVFQRGAKIVPLAKYVSVIDALAARRGVAYILMSGHLEYKDIYYPETPLHHEDWCVIVLPNDLSRNAWSFPGLISNVQ